MVTEPRASNEARLASVAVSSGRAGTRTEAVALQFIALASSWAPSEIYVGV